MRLLSGLLFSLLMSGVLNAQTVSIPGKPTEDKLPINMLKAALKYIDLEANFPYEASDSGDISFTRIAQDINNGQLDIFWSMTSKEMEKDFIPIYIPIYRGLLGMRIPIVTQKNKNLFDNIDSLTQLSNYKAGSGTFWPDTEIMKSNGMKVVTTLKYQNLFPMLEGGRFDYFPRGLHEPWQEVLNVPELNLTVEENVLIRYTAPNYFFVAKNNPKLAKKLKEAFDYMIEYGKFSQLFFADKEVQSALNKANIKNRKIFDIQNPHLSAATPLNRKELWFDPIRGQ
ncbi:MULTISPECIES: transporter substrate-binding domain-containing protein [unclassified Pseudoalteromonas]|uniref:transporter substrate-binding domain-containing protein n=1 Tax=unclassified Pseudoalteromonas TaxID=194690 RepID=UPI0005A5ED1D|nr:MULTISPECIES: transporter substrate-binding domain-containing protein [unclassified Pseudoalteromonas]